MTLTFIQKSVYGKTLFYPADEFSSSICLVANQKSLSENDLNKLSAGGFKIVVQSDVKVWKNNAEALTKSSEG